MSNSDLLLYQVIAAVPSGAICAYASYWAFSIRRRLAVPLYRNQALGVGLVALSILLVEISVTSISLARGQSNPGPLSGPPAFFVFTMIFYWIDASVLAARRSDPLLRDTLHWKHLRIVLWAVLITAVSINLVSLVFYEATGPSLASNQSPPLPLLLLLFTVFFMPGITGIVVLPVVARRSKDITFRRHLKWFGGFAALLAPFLVGIVLAVSGPQTPTAQFLGQVIIEIAFTFGGYCLYRSARSLVPLNRLVLEVVGP